METYFDPYSTPPYAFFYQAADSIVYWGPRVICALAVSYSAYPIAYDLGFIQAIDTIALNILKNIFGYVDYATFLHSIDICAAFALRVSGAIAGIMTYDLMAKIVQYAEHHYFVKPIIENVETELGL